MPVLQYVSEARVTIELVLTIGTLWWTIRTFVMMAALRDKLMHEEDDAHSHIDGLNSSLKKMESTVGKIKEKIIPGQMNVMAALVKQIEGAEKNVAKSGLVEKVHLYKEVKAFYTEQPDSRYFRSSGYAPSGDDAP